MEGMLEIVLNLKQVRFIKTVESVEGEKVTVNVAGQSELTAGYISNFLTNFKVLNPELDVYKRQRQSRVDPLVHEQRTRQIRHQRLAVTGLAAEVIDFLVMSHGYLIVRVNPCQVCKWIRPFRSAG